MTDSVADGIASELARQRTSGVAAAARAERPRGAVFVPVVRVIWPSAAARPAFTVR